MILETQGERIKKIRHSLCLSQEEFGKIFGITKQYVYSLEKDKLFLNNEKLVKLLVDFDVNINYLLTGVGKMFMSDSEMLENQTPEKTDNVFDYNGFKRDILDEVKNLLKSEGVIK